MPNDTLELDRLQAAYRTAVDKWVGAIRHEEELASVDHSVAKLDLWEQAHAQEDEFRDRVLSAKKQYEDGLRATLFGF